MNNNPVDPSLPQIIVIDYTPLMEQAPGLLDRGAMFDLQDLDMGELDIIHIVSQLLAYVTQYNAQRDSRAVHEDMLQIVGYHMADRQAEVHKRTGMGVDIGTVGAQNWMYQVVEIAHKTLQQIPEGRYQLHLLSLVKPNLAYYGVKTIR